MEQKILVLSGKKQSGKTSTSNFIHGYLMKQEGTTSNFDLDEDGNLLVMSRFADAAGNTVNEMGRFDLYQSGDQFFNYASQKIWPYVKGYNFADYLKDIACQLFGLTQEQCWGIDEQKNSLTNTTWKSVGKFVFPQHVKRLKDEGRYDSFMTAREFLQLFGTNICRKIAPDCWVNACLRQVKAENVPLAIIGDARFPNEIDIFKEAGAKIIRFGKSLDEDSHSSETALDKIDKNLYDLLLDNGNMTLEEKNNKVLETLIDWGYLKKEIV